LPSVEMSVVSVGSSQRSFMLAVNGTSDTSGQIVSSRL
jgi:hypothetical protein